LAWIYFLHICRIEPRDLLKCIKNIETAWRNTRARDMFQSPSKINQVEKFILCINKIWEHYKKWDKQMGQWTKMEIKLFSKTSNKMNLWRERMGNGIFVRFSRKPRQFGWMDIWCRISNIHVHNLTLTVDSTHLLVQCSIHIFLKCFIVVQSIENWFFTNNLDNI
jgi:hypothetical protein